MSMRWIHAVAVSVIGFTLAEVLPCLASESPPVENATASPRVIAGLAKGTWELSVMSGYTYTYRRTDAHVTKLKGVPVILGLGLIATDPIGSSWYRGQVTVGGEAQFTQYVEPMTTYLAALTPTAKYTFLTSERLRPYVEVGAGLVWTDLGDRIPEKGSQFNFNLQAGVGLSCFVAQMTSINVGYRFQHISNAHTNEPNHGIDAGVALIGISKSF